MHYHLSAWLELHKYPLTNSLSAVLAVLYLWLIIIPAGGSG